MSNMTNESDDAIFMHQSESPSAGGSSSGGSRWEGPALKKGPWTSAEDAILVDYVKKHGEGNWNAVQKHTGLSRCGKSCRLRWANHLRPNLKKGAFSQEEEQLIIELHSKMGNKWARMASHLPGRTDNEIKNYWNTRIKRRQRAGLPLYPPEMHVQRVQENQDHGKRGVIAVPKRHHDFYQASSYEQPVIPDCLKGPDALSFASDVPDWSTFGMLTKGASSLQCDTLEPPFTRCQKRYRESGAMFSGCSSIVKDEYPSSDNLHDGAPQKISRSFGLSFPCDPDHPMENELSLDVISGSHALLNGNRPASKPTFGAVKLELPSFQYQETDSERWITSSPSGFIDSVDAYIQSPPPTATVESCCASPPDSGLLDMMLHDARTRSGVKKGIKPVEKCFDSTAPGGIADCVYMGVFEPKSKDPYHPFKSLVHSESLIFSECTETHGAESSPDGSTSVAETYPGSNLKPEPVDQSWTLTTEKDSAQGLDSTRPDVMLASSWFGQDANLVKETTAMSETLAALLGDDLGTEYMHIATGTSPNQGWGFGSCAWNNMPPVCQMAELP